MSTPVECPGCGKRYKVSDKLAGRPVRCGCGKTLIVPALPPTQAGTTPGKDQLDDSLYDVLAAGPAGDGPGTQGQIAPDDIPDDLLDETIWDAEPKRETPVETTETEADAKTSPVAERAQPAPTDDEEDEPETFWDRVRSPSRELIVWMTIGYGIWISIVVIALIILLRLTFTYLLMMVLSQLVIAGGVLIKKRHPLGPSFAGLGSAGIAFFVLMATLLAGFPIHVFLLIFAVEYVFFYSVPTYIIYWCLREEEAIDEAAKRDEFYAIRDSLKERMIEENRKEWESK